MARATPTLAILYSGGVNNSDPLASIGGYASQNAVGYVESQAYTASTIPGIEITHASRNAVGDGYLSYTASNQSVTWLNPSGSPSTVLINGTGWLAVGTTTGGYLRLYITYGSLPGGDTGQTISITNLQGTLFGSPDATELTNGVTEYRAVYLKNEASGLVTDVTVVQTDNTPASTVYLGSTFNPISLYATPGASGLNFSTFNPITNTYLYDTSTSALIPRERLELLTPTMLPHFHYFPTDVTQDSDGLTTDVELTLADRYDSTNLLAAVVWGTSLYWSKILAGRMVSFWTKRVIPPNPTIPVTETLSLDITFTLS